MDVKKSVFSRLSEICKPTCILGTNTSSFLVKELVDSVSNPERLVGLHYFFHPAKNNDTKGKNRDSYAYTQNEIT